MEASRKRKRVEEGGAAVDFDALRGVFPSLAPSPSGVSQPTSAPNTPKTAPTPNPPFPFMSAYVPFQSVSLDQWEPVLLAPPSPTPSLPFEFMGDDWELPALSPLGMFELSGEERRPTTSVPAPAPTPSQAPHSTPSLALVSAQPLHDPMVLTSLEPTSPPPASAEEVRALKSKVEQLEGTLAMVYSMYQRQEERLTLLQQQLDRLSASQR